MYTSLRLNAITETLVKWTYIFIKSTRLHLFWISFTKCPTSFQQITTGYYTFSIAVHKPTHLCYVIINRRLQLLIMVLLSLHRRARANEFWSWNHFLVVTCECLWGSIYPIVVWRLIWKHKLHRCTLIPYRRKILFWRRDPLE